MEELKIIYIDNEPYDIKKPYGIRDRGGYLFFFCKIDKYPGQEKRYKKEIEQQIKLADYLLYALKRKEKITDNMLLAIEIQKVFRRGYETFYEETKAITECLNTHDKNIINTEKVVVDKMYSMGVESLPPEEFEQLEDIIKVLRSNRRALKHNPGMLDECPICHSPLEDNGKCSDVGSSPCPYQS